MLNVLFLNGPFHQLSFSRASRSPAVTKSGTVYYPIFLSYAAGLVDRDGGVNVALIDAIAKKYDHAMLIAELHRSFKPDLIFCETSTPSIKEDIHTAGVIKEAFPKSKIVMVGTHATSCAEDVLNGDKRIDAIAHGEYDETALELSNALKNGTSWYDVTGISFRVDNHIHSTAKRNLIKDLDSLPFVTEVYNKFLNPKDYFFSAAQYPMVMIMTTRGCPFKCSWCLYPQVMHGEKYRKRSPENVAAEFAYVSKEMPSVNEIGIEDDLFTADVVWLRKTCKLLIAQNNKIGFWIDTRVTLSNDDMALLKKAGCRLLIAGFESANQSVLDTIDKGTKAQDAPTFISNAKKNKLIVHGCFVLGQPGESHESMQQTIDFAKTLNPDTAQFFPMICYPGTRAYSWAKENKYLCSNDFNDWLTAEGGHNATVNLPGLPGKDVVRYCNQARREYYLRKSYMFKKLKQSFTSLQEAKRNIKAFKKLAKFLINA